MARLLHASARYCVPTTHPAASLHAIHMRSAVALHTCTKKASVSHCRQGVQDGAFVSLLKVSVAQGEHRRSDVAVGGDATKDPAAHCDTARHGCLLQPSSVKYSAPVMHADALAQG
jgi:hypothetical protein